MRVVSEKITETEKMIRSEKFESVRTIESIEKETAVSNLELVSKHEFEKDRVEKILGTKNLSDSSKQDDRESDLDKEVRIVVDFQNVPKGVDVKTSNKSKLPLKVNMGFSMDGTR